MRQKHEKPLIRRAVLVLIALGLSAPIGGISLLQYVGLGLGYDLTPIHEALLGTAALSLLMSIILAGLCRARGMAFFIVLSVLCTAGSVVWQPIAKEQEIEENRARVEQRNVSNIQNAIAVADCTDGETAVLYEREMVKDGHKLPGIFLDIVRKDRSKPARVSVGTYGLKPPNIHIVPLKRFGGQELTCSGEEYESLGDMFDVLVQHYYAERRKIYADDPLYAEKADLSIEKGEGRPIDPYELNVMIMEINEDMRKRLNVMEQYAVKIIKHRFDENGQLKDASEEIYAGNSRQLIHVRMDGKEIVEELDGDVLVTYRNGIHRYKTQWKTVQQLPLRKPFYVSGDYRRRIFAWGEPVVWEGRPARLYKYESETEPAARSWLYQMEYVVDDETGLVLFKKMIKNGEPEVESRRFIEYDWELFDSRVQAIKDNNH